MLHLDFNAAWGSLFKKRRPDEAMGFLGPFGPTPVSVQAFNANDIAGADVDHGTYLADPKLISHVAAFVNAGD